MVAYDPDTTNTSGSYPGFTPEPEHGNGRARIDPVAGLLSEVTTGREILSLALLADPVDYPALAGRMAKTLDNIAFFTAWLAPPPSQQLPDVLS